ncbi:hypothetical protein GN330_14060 [Nitratireductor sp. CAU 1489]|uniref:Lipoprotein n=1 Tax=Nitratireductor arenosus TaxID=2682096 RepID=A0A844QL56_9HYPH|nr:hypothetical protein [Nitratireductor arenosus]MVA98369.1 hypothetical protein [Nitratireductor arenosus]
MLPRLFLAVPLLVLLGCQTDTGGSGGEPLPGVVNAPAAPVDIADLVGARGAGGETQLQLRGYELARTRGLTAYWWNADTQTCAEVVTANGRYESVVGVSPAECDA